MITLLRTNTVQVITATGMIALTLIALPMGVFAQTETDSLNEEVISQTNSDEPTNAETTPQTDPYYDNYKREELPGSTKVFNDFVVGPGRFELEIAPGETKVVQLNVSNRLGSRRIFQFTTEDMTSSEGNESTIKLLGDAVGPYTIKDYITVSHERFYVEHNERVIIPVTVSIPPDAEPGGFYGSILTEVMPEERSLDDSDVAPATALVSRIGTLFYVTTPGDIDHEGSLIDFTTIPDKSMYFDGPINMGLVYENTGSVHITPHGEVTVTNLLGETVGQVEILPWFVMPNSVRTREVLWNREFLIGRYTATAYINRGYENNIDTLSVVFWVLPWKFLSTVFAGVFIFFLTIRFFVRNFEFKKK